MVNPVLVRIRLKPLFLQLQHGWRSNHALLIVSTQRKIPMVVIVLRDLELLPLLIPPPVRAKKS
jgi:hypothetical protein